MAFRKRQPTDRMRKAASKVKPATTTTANPRADATAKFQAAKAALVKAKTANDSAAARTAHDAIKAARQERRAIPKVKGKSASAPRAMPTKAGGTVNRKLGRRKTTY